MQKECVNCKEKFFTIKNGTQRIYCSTRCSERFRYRLKYPKKDIRSKDCSYCGNKFTPHYRSIDKQKYCSILCSKRYWYKIAHPELYKERYNSRSILHSKSDVMKKVHRMKYGFHNYTPNTRFKNIMKAAHNRGYEFGLTFEEYMSDFWEKECYYCGEENKGGIDRVDNTIGYLSSNSVPCCMICNKMKLQMTVQELLERCKKIVNKLYLTEHSIKEGEAKGA